MKNSRPNILTSNPEVDLELIQRVGSGTYGEVHKARVRATGELAAVKIINVEPGDNFEIIQQEICLMQDCKHPNIVLYHGSYLRKNKLWIAMEYCGGGSLQDAYHVTGPLTESMVGSVCTEMLKGLDYMHKQHKIHRDIKGANVLLTVEGDVKLADFGVGAQITSTIGKRSSFIGTPYWMAPEVAAVERTGGYSFACDIWAVGITAIELAECQPPLFDLHPMRALYLISKRSYTPPVLKDKNKWSSSMKDFLKLALTKNPKKRPAAEKLLQHTFCQGRSVRTSIRELLDKFEILKQTKKSFYQSDANEEEEKTEKEMEKTVKRIISKKSKAKKDGVKNPDKNAQPVKKETEPQRAETIRKEVQDSTLKADLNQPSLPHASLNVPKLLPRNHNPTNYETIETDSKPPPIPLKPKQNDSTLLATYENTSVPPPLPPRLPAPDRPVSQVFIPKTSKNCFNKIFHDSPISFTCSTDWTHPETKVHYLIFASVEDGIYSLNLDDLENIEMFQIFARSCKWVYVVKNKLISISGEPSYVYMHCLVQMHSLQAREQFASVPKAAPHTTKVPGSSNAQKCCVVHNPYNNQLYLYIAMKNAILLLQWYEPLQKFMIVRNFDIELPTSLLTFEAIVQKESEYPILCVGAYERSDCSILLDILDIDSGAPWELKKEYKRVDVKAFSQLEKNVILIAYEEKVIFVDVNGNRVGNPNCLTELHFSYPIDSAVCLPGSVLTFNSNGIQGKSVTDGQVTAQFTDNSRLYKLLGSDRIVVIESRVRNEKVSNLYILASS